MQDPYIENYKNYWNIKDMTIDFCSYCHSLIHSIWLLAQSFFATDVSSIREGAIIIVFTVLSPVPNILPDS